MVSQKQKLALLSFTGILVNDDGRIADHAGYPTATDQPAVVRSYRVAFDEEDDRFLVVWLDKATAQGISLQGPRFFKDLERVVRALSSVPLDETDVHLLDLFTSYVAVMATALETGIPGSGVRSRNR